MAVLSAEPNESTDLGGLNLVEDNRCNAFVEACGVLDLPRAHFGMQLNAGSREKRWCRRQT